ncbi:MAG: Fe-S cluster assembly protein SufD [Clostridia bacterium]|nr:Fe-S cluster assembly protein SufD [Clostridia bacterium]
MAVRPSLAERTIGELDAEALRAWSAARGEPEWLTDLRLAAWNAFVELPVPNRQMEDWNRLNLQSLPLAEFPAHSPGRADSPEELPEEARRALATGPEASALVQVNGTAAFRRLGPEAEKAGVVFCDLARAAREEGEVVRRALTSVVPKEADKFSALSAALWSDGFYLRVPRGAALTVPLATLRVRTGDGATSISRTLVLLEEGAECALVETQTGEGGRPGLDANVVEIRLGPGARLRYVGLQNWDEEMWSFCHRRAFLGPASHLTWVFGEFGGRVARSSFVSDHAGDGSGSESLTVFFSSGRQHHDIFQTMYHTARRTEANMDVRGALSGQGRCVFRGDIDIERGAKGTSSFETAHALVLEKGARADAIPSLYIDENDVRASHSATTGQIDPEQLFYLMTRGLSQRVARRLIVRGFFEPILDQVPLASVRAEFERLIDRKLA